MLQRQRKINVIALFWTLILGFSSGTQKTFANLRRAYELQTGTLVAPSSFWNRFTDELAYWLKQVVERLLNNVFEPVGALQGLLACFQDVLATDSTIMKLHQCLAAHYPGTGPTKAGVKLHLVMSVIGRGLKSMTLAKASCSEHKLLRVGPWLKGKLLLFDLGFYAFKLFANIDKEGGFFVSRLKSNANPLIVSENWYGYTLQEALAATEKTPLDVIVALPFKRRVYRNHRRSDVFYARVVALYDEGSQEWHLYVTNLSEDFQPEEIAILYRARWAVELLFRQFKRSCLLDQIPTKQPAAVKAFIWASVISWLVSEGLLKELSAYLRRKGWQVKPERWGKLFALQASQLLTVMIGPYSQRRFWERRLWALWCHEAAEPLSRRLSLLEQVEQGLNYAYD